MPIGKPTNPRSSKGYTLIEVLVATTIIMVVTASGIAAYRNFIERQSLTNAGRELVSMLRDAQKRATSGDKPDACSGSQLQSWSVESLNDSSYSLTYRCVNPSDGTVITDSVRVIELSRHGAMLAPDSDLDISFAVITGRPSAPASIRLTRSAQADKQYLVEVNSAGAINDIGVENDE